MRLKRLPKGRSPLVTPLLEPSAGKPCTAIAAFATGILAPLSRWFVTLLLIAAPASAADQDELLGIWQTEMNEAKVEIVQCGEKICGSIVWLKDPLYTDSRDGPVGTPLLDFKNPDPALRIRPVLGLRVLEGFSQAGTHLWSGGTCYDPKSGKTYRGKLRLVAPDRLELRGYVGIPLFGRTAVWAR